MAAVPMNVTLVDHMGSDLSVVNSARVSFDKESNWEFDGEKTQLSILDAKLINYLAKHKHWSPFAHTSITVRVKAPIFVARQLVKHQVGGVWNEVSRRYVDDKPEFYLPDTWRERPEGSVKQGSGDDVEDQIEANLLTETLIDEALFTYEKLLSLGVAPEQARMILPQNTMTEWYWTGSLYFFTRVCHQRLDAHAQKETREIAERIAEVIAPLYPVSWSALMDKNK